MPRFSSPEPVDPQYYAVDFDPPAFDTTITIYDEDGEEIGETDIEIRMQSPDGDFSAYHNNREIKYVKDWFWDDLKQAGFEAFIDLNMRVEYSYLTPTAYFNKETK